jgi:outer membrane protein insertion porin family
MYWAATTDVQTPLYFLPKDVGVKIAGFVDVGSLWDYKGPTSYQGQTVQFGGSNDGMDIRASAGVGFLWDSPLGPIRFDFAFPFMKESFDKTQWFRFSGGTSF